MEAVVIVVLWRRAGHGSRSSSRTAEEVWPEGRSSSRTVVNGGGLAYFCVI